MPKLKPNPIEKTIKYINDKTMYGLDIGSMKPYYALVNNEDIFCDILIRIANNPSVDHLVYMERLAFAITKLYPKIVTKPDNLVHFYNLLNIYLANPELITEKSLDDLSNAFSDKSLIYETYLYLSHPERFKDLKLSNLDLLTTYLTNARELYVDDRALYTSFINLITNKLGIDVLNYGTPEQIEEAINDKIRQDRKINGDYDIDEAIIREFDRKIESMGLLRASLDSLISIAESERANISTSVENASEELTSRRIKELKILSEEARKKIAEFDKSYLELLNQQKQRVYDDRDTLIAEIDEYFAKKKQELEFLVDKVSQDVALEITRIKRASNDSIGTLKSYVESDESINRIIREANSNNDLYKKIAFVEELASKFDDRPIIPSISEPTVRENGKSTIVAPITEKIVVPNQTIVVPTSNVDEPIDYTVNYYFDKSIKFKERLKTILERKHKLEEQGEIFHEKFDDVLTMIIENDCPYMYGPSGCGKTYMVDNQLSKLLDLPIIKNGYISFEQDIIGCNNVGNGDYIRTNFYRAYRNGKGFFFDEIDNSNANATTILNSFLQKRGNSTYAFPNGVTVARHPNFRIITAGNTKGTGKTVAYNTRQKIDESVMQRLTPIEIDYDNRIEKGILKDYPGWFEFIVLFRKAIEEYNANGDEKNTIGTFTTRDAENIRDYKDDDAFSDEKLIDYQIIENKHIDYLRGIQDKMKSGNLKTKEGKELLKIFNNRVDEKVRNANRSY